MRAVGVMDNNYHEMEKKLGFRARLSSYIQNRHPDNAAKRVARDIARTTGEGVPVSTIYKWIEAQAFPSLDRLALLLATYPGLALALYGDLVDTAREQRSARLEAIIADASLQLEALAHD